MVCQSCGTHVAGPGAFCSRCGVQSPAFAPGAPYAPQTPPPAPPMYPQPLYTRVARHLQALGILWFVYGAFRAASGLFGALFLTGLAHNGLQSFGLPGHIWGMPRNPIVGAMAGMVIVFTGITAVLAFLTGYGLTARLPWARILAIVAAILALFHPLSGTALGIYTLWVLAPGTSGIEYDAIADRT